MMQMIMNVESPTPSLLLILGHQVCLDRAAPRLSMSLHNPDASSIQAGFQLTAAFERSGQPGSRSPALSNWRAGPLQKLVLWSCPANGGNEMQQLLGAEVLMSPKIDHLGAMAAAVS